VGLLFVYVSKLVWCPQEYLPQGYTYKICKFEANSSNEHDFYVKVRMTNSDRFEVDKWFEQFSDLCKVSWLVSKSVHAGNDVQDKRKYEYQVWFHVRPHAYLPRC